MKIVIRAGGNGTRLWPLSRQDKPKQFHSLIGENSMIRNTFNRVSLAAGEAADIFVSVNQAHATKVREELPELAELNLILETDVRNTGPAMCLEVCFLEQTCAPETIVASLPSDDYINDEQAFADLLAMSAAFIREHTDYILTPAVRPAYLDTGYSYLKPGEELAASGTEAIYRVAKVVEKPNTERCQELIDSGNYYCHTGMYIWQLGNIAKLFAELQPAMYALCYEAVALMQAGAPLEKVEALYAQTEKMTIESAITNQAPKIAMSVSDRIGWSDLGKWHIIKKMLAPETNNNLTRGKVIAHEANNNLIFSNTPGKVVVVNDLSGLVIVDTPDALYISSAENSAEVKTCLEKVKEQGWSDCL